jgi:hypothetical protein
VRVGHDGAVVEEHVDVILGGQEPTDVSVEYEIRLHRPLDRLDDVWIGGAYEVADLLADPLLPLGQRVDVRVDPGILEVGHIPRITRIPPVTAQNH